MSDVANRNRNYRPRCGVGAGQQVRMVERAWYVIRTKRAAERRAQLHLERRGVVTYLPMLGPSSCAESGDPCAAVFPQHLLVHVVLTRDLHRVLWTPGVKSFVPNFGEARPLRDDVVAVLRARYGPGDFSPAATTLLADPDSGRARVWMLLKLLDGAADVGLPARSSRARRQE